MTSISETTPKDAVDRKYVAYGKELEARRINVFDWKREPGSNREWFVQGQARRYGTTGGGTAQQEDRPNARCGTPTTPQELPGL